MKLSCKRCGGNFTTNKMATREQRAILKDLTELAEKLGRETITKEIPWKEPSHTEITEFLDKSAEFEKASREVNLEVEAYIGKIEQAYKNTGNSKLIFKRQSGERAYAC